MNHTTAIVVVNEYGRIITQVASGYNTHIQNSEQKRGGKHIVFSSPLLF
jgi:hypothetical protein